MSAKSGRDMAQMSVGMGRKVVRAVYAQVECDIHTMATIVAYQRSSWQTASETQEEVER